MHPRATELIHSLGLTPHPEGGHYGEVYRSEARVRPDDGRPDRSALTTIYFLLVTGEESRWHRVASDEVWHFYEGDPLLLRQAGLHFEGETEALLGPHAADTRPVQVVPAGHWQAARTTGAYSLVGCTVAPGFVFEDFEMR